jgi:hypothetical protein
MPTLKTEEITENGFKTKRVFWEDLTEKDQTFEVGFKVNLAGKKKLYYFLKKIEAGAPSYPNGAYVIKDNEGKLKTVAYNAIYSDAVNFRVKREKVKKDNNKISWLGKRITFLPFRYVKEAKELSFVEKVIGKPVILNNLNNVNNTISKQNIETLLRYSDKVYYVGVSFIFSKEVENTEQLSAFDVYRLLNGNIQLMAECDKKGISKLPNHIKRSEKKAVHPH